MMTVAAITPTSTQTRKISVAVIVPPRPSRPKLRRRLDHTARIGSDGDRAAKAALLGR